ncbi:MAG: hypothetical protein ABIR32_22455 [Ilumatobacteraceae bacterium]
MSVGRPMSDSAGISTNDRTRNRTFLPALVIGWAIIAYGAKTALDDETDAHPFALVVHVVAFDLAHDLFVAPIVLMIGWLTGRLLPLVARGPVRAACAVSAMFVIFAYPLLHRWGRRPTNSSTLPLEYGRNLVILITIVWTMALVTIARRVVRAKP